MISVTILIPFPVSISTCLSINVLLPSLILLWVLSSFTKSSIFNRILMVRESYRVIMLILFLKSKGNFTTTTRKTIANPNPSPKTITNSNGSSGGTVYDDSVVLHDDVWVEILWRLPPKQMVRCKTMSKSWNYLISNVCIPKITSPFYGLFLPIGTSSNDDGHWDFITYTSGFPNPSFLESCFGLLPFTCPEYFLNTCNGLLLFFHKPSRIFYVCNPSTDQCIVLPKPPQEEFLPYTAAFTFDDDDPAHYNVVYMILTKLSLTMGIFSSMTRKWEVRQAHVDDDDILKENWSTKLVFLHGFLYGLSMSRHLLKFDTRQVTVRAIKLPELVERNNIPRGCLGLSIGQIHYAWNDIKTYRMLVWILDENQWVLKYNFRLVEFAKCPLPGIRGCLFYVYAFHPTSDVIFLGNMSTIVSYHPATKKMECIYRLRNGAYIGSGPSFVFPFSRNLATLDACLQ